MRAVQDIIPTRFILSEAGNGERRSRARYYFIGIGEPGTLLNLTYTSDTSFAVPAAFPNNVNAILMERQVTTGAQFRLMLARHAEVNDAYLEYGNFSRTAVNLALAVNAGIIVRNAIAESSGIAGGIFDDPAPDELAEPEAETAAVPAPVEPAPPPAVSGGLHGWAIVLNLGRWALGLALRWGRRR